MFVKGIGRAGEEATTTHAAGPLVDGVTTTPTFVGVVEDDGLVVDVAIVVVGLDVDDVVGCGCC